MSYLREIINVAIKFSILFQIKYGGLESLDEDSVLTRRTRGKKINYQEITGSDSEDEIRNRKAKCSRIIESDDDFIAENEKDEDLQDGESEVDSVVDEEEYEKKSDDRDYLKIRKNSSGKKKNILEKIKKKKWVIPDPDDFSENDLMEDEQLDKVAEELEDLDEEEEEILGNILESGDVPIHELKAAVKRAKEEKILRNEVETKTIELEENESIKIAPNSFLPASGHSESVGGGKFPKIGKVKITPSRAELASKLTGVPAQTALTAAGKPKNFVQNSVRACSPEKVTESPDSIHLKEKSIDPDNSESGLLFKSLQDDLKNSGSVHVNIPPNRSFKSDTSLQIPGPFITYSVEAGSGSSLNTMGTLMSSQSQAAPGSSIRGFGMLPTSVNSGHSVPEFNALQGLVSPPRIPLYTSAIPTTVTGLSNLDSQSPRKKPGPKPGTKLKRKLDDSSPQSENSNGAAEPSESILSAQQADELSQTKNIQDFSPKKKGRGRGKKQLLAEAQAQGSTLGKQDPTLSTVQTSSQFSSQSLTSEGGSVITRILNSPQGPQSTQAYLGSDSNQFPAPPRNRPTFAPSITSHFQSSRSLPALRLRSPVSGGTMFHTSHPLDPSPSGGGAINIPITSSGVAKSTPPPLNFNRTSSLAIIPPRFTSESATRPVFPSRNSPPRPEFSFTNYYGSFSQSGSSVASSEGSSFQSSTFQESFGEEVQMSGGASSKHFEDEISGEFGGLASYFASQREDDLDT